MKDDSDAGKNLNFTPLDPGDLSVLKMLDMQKRMEASLRKVQFYGNWLTYGGLFVIIASIITFIVEFLRMMHIARLP